MFPDELMVDILAHVLDSHEESKKGVIFDGFPRTIAQAEALTTYGQLGIKVWICKGEVYGKRELVPNALVGAQKENNNRPNNAGKKGGFKKRKK